MDGELYVEYAEEDRASEEGLSWSSLVVPVDGSGWPRAVGEVPRKPARQGDTSCPVSTGLAPIKIHTGHHQATLTHYPGKPGTVLWLRDARPGDRVTAPPLLDTGHAVAYLNLPLHWPADATVELLHPQIIDTVRAAVSTVDGPVLVGGHSFSATLALYALAHVPELRGAIVHSGCYNRTLTTTGWQHEKRHLWQAPDIYRAFSAVEFAQKLDRPVLLAHGVDDANPATPAEQSVGLYKAIVATGGTARLLLLPGEGHAFRYAEHTAFLTSEHRSWIERWAQ
nr:prolyl oligopeptidase family serine peptidase [Nonomuraea sp. K271]